MLNWIVCIAYTMDILYSNSDTTHDESCNKFPWIKPTSCITRETRALVPKDNFEFS